MAAEGFAPDEMAGSGRWLFETARCLVRRGDQVTVMVRRIRPDLLPEETIEGIHVFRYGTGNYTTSSWKGFLDVFSGIKLFRKVRASGKFDLLHLFQPLSGLMAMAGGGGSPPLPRVYTYFSPWHEEYLVNCGRSRPRLSPGYWLRFLIERLVVSRCSKIIVLSDFSRNQIARYHPGLEKRCRKVPGGVDLEKFTLPASKPDVRRSLGIKPDDFLLLSIRNLRRRMGLLNLVEAMPAIRKKIPNSILCLGGSGPLGPRLTERINQLGLSSAVRMLGKVPDAQLPAWYQAADLFVLPTEKLEGFGLITLEAMACGTPVMATPVGANVELVSRFDQSLLTGSTDPAGLAEAIIHYHGRGSRDAVGARSLRDFSSQYSWDLIAGQTGDCYAEAGLL
jgi:glycosyltransferase involved in cell wall biosynthesis